MADSYYPPDGTPDDGGAQDDVQPDGAGPATEGNQAEPGPDGKEATEDGETALVASSAFGGKMPEPGQRCTFEVVHCYEDECELKYVIDDGEKGEETESPEMAGAMGKLNAIAK